VAGSCKQGNEAWRSGKFILLDKQLLASQEELCSIELISYIWIFSLCTFLQASNLLSLSSSYSPQHRLSNTHSLYVIRGFHGGEVKSRFSVLLHKSPWSQTSTLKMELARPPKRWFTPTKVHGATTRRTTNSTLNLFFPQRERPSFTPTQKEQVLIVYFKRRVNNGYSVPYNQLSLH